MQKYLSSLLTGLTVEGQTDGIAGKSTTRFNHAWRIVLDSTENPYVVSDMFNHRWQRYEPSKTMYINIIQ